MKTKKLFIAGLIVSAILFIAACAMVAVSAVVSKQEMDLGIDLSGYNVTKMHTDNETIRVFGTQDGEVFGTRASEHQYELIRELLEPEFGAMFVTPQDMDERICKLSAAIAEGIRRAVERLEEER